MPALILMAALLADRLFGEPRRWHPLVGFGRLVRGVEARLHPVRTPATGPWTQRVAGAIGLVLLTAPFTALAAWLSTRPVIGVPCQIALLYGTIGHRSLAEHARAVAAALDAGDLPLARERVGMIVSRDTAALDETGVARATIESVLENGNDAVFAALFWFLVLGAPGAVLYRLANTLDAMWGYRTARYTDFGKAAARFDDLLNLVPARLTALSYVLLGHTRNGWRCWQAQAASWYSPNAGPVMAAGAGALSLQLGGTARYHGHDKSRPDLGAGRPPVAADIGRALSLVRHGVLLWAACALLAAGALHA